MQKEQVIVAIQYHKSLGYIAKPLRAVFYPGTTSWKITHSYMNSDSNLSGYETDAEKQIIELARAYRDDKILSSFGSSGFEKNNTKEKSHKKEKENVAQKHVISYVQKKVYAIVEILKTNDIPVLFKENNNINEPLITHLKVHPEDAIVFFRFTRSQEGIRYDIQFKHRNQKVSLKDKPYMLLSEKPCAYVIGDEIYTFRDIEGSKLKPFFGKSFIEVPARLEDQYFRGFIKKVLRDYDIIAEGFDVYEYNPEPEPFLTLSQNLTGHLALKLSFQYKNQQVIPTDKKQNLVFYYDQPERKSYEKIFRDLQQEKDIFGFLENTGLRSRDSVYFVLDQSDTDDIDLVSWLNQKHDILIEKGFQIARNQEVPPYQTGNVNLESEVTENSKDWFDIHTVIIIGNQEIPFIYLRKHILEGNRHYKLPDGSIFIIPKEWFVQYKDLMYFARETKNGSFSLQKHHFSLLRDIDQDNLDLPAGELEKLYTSELDQDISQPENLKVQLRHYQLQGYAWLQHLHQYGFGGCLADDMGLGKTIQTLALLVDKMHETTFKENDEGRESGQLSLFEQSKGRTKTKPSLIVMPTSLLHNWESEIARFAPQLKAIKYTGNRRHLPDNFHDYDLILTSYGIARIDAEILSTYNFFYLILDESQYIKNPYSKTYQAIKQLKSDHRLVLTGTPIENSLTDLWAQFHFLNEGLLGDYTSFTNRYMLPVERDKDSQVEEKLQQLIKPFLLRRKKSEVATELPPLTEQVVYCEMTEDQQEIYEKYKSGIRNTLINNLTEDDISKNQIQILEALLRLRQMSNHPLLADTEYGGSSGKFNEIMHFIDSIMAEGHKAIFFSSFVEHLSLIADHLDNEDYRYKMLTGETRNRKEAVRAFQEDEDVRIFLVSLKAGGTGLNLTAADYVFILDPWWNPATEFQAMNRAHRIGQDKNIFVYRLITQESIEEKIFTLQKRKTDLANTLINNNNPFKSMTAEQVKELFK